MENAKCSVPFTDTPKQSQKLLDVINEYKDLPGALIPILHSAQNIYGYLPMEIQKTIAQSLDISLEKVYGVCTFYAQFTLNPKGKYNISVCLGTACYVKGGGDIFDKISNELGIKSGECTADGLFSLEACRCIGACGLAPVMKVNEDIFGRVKPSDIPSIIQKYKDM